MKRHALSLLLGLAVVLAAALPAAAIRPNKFDLDIPPIEFSHTDCGFQVDFYFEREATVHEFFDQDGTIRQVVMHWRGLEGTATNPANDKVITAGREAWKDVIEFEDGVPTTLTSVGLPAHFNVPGSGVVLHEAGRIVFDYWTWEVLEIKGPHPVWEGDFDTFCAALADDG
jgi:hypothetical protein